MPTAWTGSSVTDPLSVVRTDVLSENDDAAVGQGDGPTVSGASTSWSITQGGPDRSKRPPRTSTWKPFRHIMELNVLGTFIVCKYAIPSMIERRDGRIVNNIRNQRPARIHQPSRVLLVQCGRCGASTRTLALELGQVRHNRQRGVSRASSSHGDRMTKIVNTKAATLGVTPEEVYDDFASQNRPPAGSSTAPT